jgi:hypothetical protein
MSDQTTTQLQQSDPLPETPALTGAGDGQPDPPCCTLPPPDPGPST